MQLFWQKSLQSVEKDGKKDDNGSEEEEDDDMASVKAFAVSDASVNM